MNKDDYIIVNFLDIDPKLFEFHKPRKNQHNGYSYVTLRYAGKRLFVQYDKRVCPFGLNINTQDEEITGYGTSISLKKDYINDPYYNHARMLDEFFY